MNFQREFEKECREKKRIASGEKHRVKNTRRKVMFPSDYMSKVERRQLSGEVVSYNLNKPMGFETFKKLGDDIQAKYIQGLMERFGVSRREIAWMMGCSDSTLKRMYEKCGIKAKKGGSHEWKADAWLSWLCEPADFMDLPNKEYVVNSADEHVEENTVETQKTVTERHDYNGNEIILGDIGKGNLEDLIRVFEGFKKIGCHTKITMEIEV